MPRSRLVFFYRTHYSSHTTFMLVFMTNEYRVSGIYSCVYDGLAECDQISTEMRSSFTVGTAPGMATPSTSKIVNNTFGL
jgi:hypothetical protein